MIMRGGIPARDGGVGYRDESGGASGGDVGGFAGFNGDGLVDDVDLLGFEDLVGGRVVVVGHGEGGADEALGGGPLGGFAVGDVFWVVLLGGVAHFVRLRDGVGGWGGVVVGSGAAIEVVFFRKAGFGEAH